MYDIIIATILGLILTTYGTHKAEKLVESMFNELIEKHGPEVADLDNEKLADMIQEEGPSKLIYYILIRLTGILMIAMALSSGLFRILF